MKKALALLVLSILLMGTGYGPGPVGPPGPGPGNGSDAPAPAVGPNAAGEGGVACDARNGMPTGQSCGRRQPSGNIFDFLKGQTK